MDTTPFTLDGKNYNVRVMSLKRVFKVLDTDKTTRFLNGGIYRDIVGTYYNYEMTVSSRQNDMASLDALWDAVSQPADSHVCVFPYNQHKMTQRMYITSGEQQLKNISPSMYQWGEIKLSFVATDPKVVP